MSETERKLHYDLEIKEGGDAQKAEEPLTIQQKVEEFFNDSFGRWGEYLTLYPCRVFWFSILFFVILSGGMAKRAGFDDESIVWTPSNNPSLQARTKGSELFPSTGGFIGLLAEVKNPTDTSASIITTAAIAEIKAFQARLQAVNYTYTATTGESKVIRWDDLCIK